MFKGKLWSQDQIHPTLWRYEIYVDQGHKFSSGQYVRITVQESATVVGFFSIASHPTTLPFLVFYTRKPWTYPLGTVFFLSDAQGQMTFVDFSSYALIAAGTGITPFLSLIQEFSLKKQENWRLLWVIGTQDDLILLKDLDMQLRAKIHPFLHDGLDDQKLTDALSLFFALGASERLYLAGSYAFIDKIGQFLLQEKIYSHEQLFSDLKKFSSD